MKIEIITIDRTEREFSLIHEYCSHLLAEDPLEGIETKEA